MVPHGRVHPAAATSSSDFSGEMNQSAASSDPSSSPLYSFHFEKPVPPTAQPPPSDALRYHQQQPPPAAGTYVVQMPKDKVFRVPPPENARLFQHYSRRAKRRASCSCVRVCSWLLLALLVLAVVLAVLAAVVYLVFKPRQPDYTLQSLAVSGLVGILGNASSSSSSTAPVTFSPEFDATIRADNPNDKIGVHYEGDGSHVAVSYGGVRLADGAWPAFYQGPKNVTVFVATAKGSGIRFSERFLREIAADGRLRSVPFDVDIKLPVRLQLGGVKTWAVPVSVRCTVAVDRLAADAKVVSKSCNVKVRFLFWKN
ncbi:NDR1/HIN1-like protein 13 [Oryza brachyantha]|uniref:NDR1/HIN1-like protein 13 n=1 Tax=Oryza brachyantha TaxID=4533 RepID=UPI001AD9EECB|nr:NDR1/HIN1-like protein 13 [Oryza brachyantha]